MEVNITLQKIKDSFENDVIEIGSPFGQDTVVLAPSALLAAAAFLKEDAELHYNCLMDLTAVDHWKRKPRFDVVYHFLSVANRFRLRLKVPLSEPEPTADSLTSLWPSANWYEREVYDMFGIQFSGHPDLRRILLYPEFEGHPLRKDYPIQKRQPLVGPKH